MSFPTYVAGERITASTLNALVPKYLRQSSDQSLSTTTFTNHNTFAAISFGASETWAVVMNLFHNSANAGNDIKTTWTVSGGLTLASYRAIVSPGLTATSTADVAGNFQGRATGDSVSHGSTTSASVFGVVHEEFVVVCTTAGTLTLQWAQASATSGATTTLAGSYLTAHRLS